MARPRVQFIDLIRKTSNALNPEIVDRQLADLNHRAIGKTYRRFGWRAGEKKLERQDLDHGYEYHLTLRFIKAQERERDNSDDVFKKQFAHIARKTIQFGRALGWMPAEQQSNKEAAALVGNSQPKEFDPRIPDDIAPWFAHIFDREPQVRVIYAALNAAKRSNFTKRNHCLLWGRPACGKSELLLAFEKMVGPDNCVKLDATATTKAGAENLILEMDEVPPVLIIEELEKCNILNLPWLLGVLDQRGEIRKTNARIGTVHKQARCLCLATVNDLRLFNTIMSGALASRFQHKIYCPRPGRAVLEKILAREVAEMNGNPAWIRPALDYAIDVEKTDDPRRCIAILDGQDKLLTGEYQMDLMRLMEAMNLDNVNSNGEAI